MKRLGLLLLCLSACGGNKGRQDLDGLQPKVCEDFKAQDECTLKTRFEPRCLWMSNTCVPDSMALRSLMSSGYQWKASVAEPDEVFGQTVKLDWQNICGVAKGGDSFDAYITEVKVAFVKDTDKLKLTLDCYTTNPTFEFTYSGIEKNGSLLLTLDAPGAKIPGTYEGSSINILDFFTKAAWMYDRASHSFVAISLYDKIFGKSQNSIPLTTKADFDAAIKYVKDKNGGVEVAKGVKGFGLIFKQTY